MVHTVRLALWTTWSTFNIEDDALWTARPTFQSRTGDVWRFGSPSQPFLANLPMPVSLDQSAKHFERLDIPIHKQCEILY